MRPYVRLLTALTAVSALTLTGCGGSAEERSATEPSPSQQTPADADADADADAGAVEVEVEIEDGRVSPAGERVDVRLGQTIRLVVDSDAADEIHVHSTPEHSFRVSAGADDKVFEFALRQPGVVEAELHELGDVVVTFAARP